MKNVEEAIKSRRSMPGFDSTKKISDEDLTKIINAGRLAPSGLGSEPTRVLVIKDAEIKKEIAQKAYNELNWEKVQTADALILFVSVKGNIFKSKEFIGSRIERWGITDQGEKEMRIGGYVDYLSDIDGDVYSANQAFIGMSYMTIQTAALGIESVIMQGFDFENLNQLLGQKGYINAEKESVYISMGIGYINEEIKNKIHPQIRLSLDEYCQYI